MMTWIDRMAMLEPLAKSSSGYGLNASSELSDLDSAMLALYCYSPASRTPMTYLVAYLPIALLLSLFYFSDLTVKAYGRQKPNGNNLPFTSCRPHIRAPPCSCCYLFFAKGLGLSNSFSEDRWRISGKVFKILI